MGRQRVDAARLIGQGELGGRLAFVVINTASMLIPIGCLAFTRYVLGLTDPLSDNIAANVVGLGLGTAARFWAFRRFIFLSPRRLAKRRLEKASLETTSG